MPGTSTTWLWHDGCCKTLQDRALMFFLMYSMKEKKIGEWMIVSLIGRIHQYHWCSLDPKWIPHFLWIICTSWQRWTWILSPPATVVTRVFKGSSHWSVTYLQRIKRIKVSFVGRIIRFTSWSLSWSMLCILATGLTHPPPQPLFADSAAMATAQDPYCLPSLSHIMLSFQLQPISMITLCNVKGQIQDSNHIRCISMDRI